MCLPIFHFASVTGPRISACESHRLMLWALGRTVRQPKAPLSVLIDLSCSFFCLNRSQVAARTGEIGVRRRTQAMSRSASKRRSRFSSLWGLDTTSKKKQGRPTINQVGPRVNTKDLQILLLWQLVYTCVCMRACVSLYWHVKSTWHEVSCARHFLISNLYPKQWALLLICHHHPSPTCTLPKLWLITDLLKKSAEFVKVLRREQRPQEAKGALAVLFLSRLRCRITGSLQGNVFISCPWDLEGGLKWAAVGTRTQECESGHHGFFCSGPRLAEDLLASGT